MNSELYQNRAAQLALCALEKPAAEAPGDPVRDLLRAAAMYREIGMHDIADGCFNAAFFKAMEVGIWPTTLQ